MQQPIIDPNKVNAWTASMRQAFGPSSIDTWLVIGFSVAILLVVAYAAWSAGREPKHRV